MFVGTAVGLGPSVQAHAAPTPAEIEAELNAAWEKLEPLVEQYNKVHSDLKKLRAKADKVQRSLAPLQAASMLSRSRLGTMASQYYQIGRAGEINAMISGGASAQRLPDRLMMLDQLARIKQQKIDETAQVTSKLSGDKAELDKLIAATAKRDADLSAKKKTIEAEMARLERLRTQAYGTPTVSTSGLKIGSCPALAPSSLISNYGPTSKNAIAVKYACGQIGDPYVWGASGPGSFDCSGLTQAAWKQAGESLTHYTGAQWNETVSVGNPIPGDLVFFYGDLHHVGIYVGNGLMVHAPRSGDRVRMQYIKYMPVAGYRRPRL